MKAAALMNTVKQPTDSVCVNAQAWVRARVRVRTHANRTRQSKTILSADLKARVEYALHEMNMKKSQVLIVNVRNC